MPHPEHLRKHIVIIGGGFAGLAAALQLEQLRQADDEYNVTLIDRNCYHLYHALLYKVATAAMDITEADLEFLQSGVCVRLKALHHILLKKNVNVIQNSVTGIDLNTQDITLADQTTVMFDYAVLALGSETNYFGIPGLAEHSLSLKDLPDALNIHLKLDRLFEQVMKEQRPVTVVVGGGGVSGVEMAGEIRHYALRLCRQHQIDPSLVKVEILEAGPGLLAGLDPWVQTTAKKRLDSLGVMMHFGSPITEVTGTMVVVKDGTTHPFDLMIWCGGIQAHHLLRQMGAAAAGNKSQLVVNDSLQLPNHAQTYAVGDGMYLLDPATQRPLPQIAPLAIAEGQRAARNIYRQLHHQPPRPYVPEHPGFVIPIGGRWAISTLGPKVSGRLAWVVRKYVDLQYFLSILNRSDAWKVFLRGGQVYLKND